MLQECRDMCYSTFTPCVASHTIIQSPKLQHELGHPQCWSRRENRTGVCSRTRACMQESLSYPMTQCFTVTRGYCGGCHFGVPLLRGSSHNTANTIVGSCKPNIFWLALMIGSSRIAATTAGRMQATCCASRHLVYNRHNARMQAEKHRCLVAL